jgi:hypothetical protein
VLVLWCVFHHHFRHRPDVELIGDANDLSIKLPDGRVVPLPPRGPTHASNGAWERATSCPGDGAPSASGTPTNSQGNLFSEDAA